MSGLRFLALVALASCQSVGQPPDASVPKVAAPPPARVPQLADRDFVMPPLPHRRVTLQGASGPVVVDAEIARTVPQRTRGLMWREVLPEGTGMLFIFERDDWLSFWMKNTLIPLDMLFIDSRLVVVGLVENAEPQTLSPRTPGDVQSQYVLEVPGGWARKVGVKLGSKVQVEDLAALSGEP